MVFGSLTGIAAKTALPAQWQEFPRNQKSENSYNKGQAKGMKPLEVSQSSSLDHSQTDDLSGVPVAGHRGLPTESLYLSGHSKK